jgi:hypothetical protein
MIIPASSYWNIGLGRKKGDVEGDEEDRKIMEDMGKTWLGLLKG